MESAEKREEVKKSYNPLTDNIMDIPDENEVVNESLRNFKPPLEEMPDKSLLSIESRLPDTARKGMRGGVPIEHILMSEDSIEDWRHFTPGYISPQLENSQSKRVNEEKDDFLDSDKDDSMNDRAISKRQNPLLDYVIKPSTLKKEAKVAPDAGLPPSNKSSAENRLAKKAEP